MNQDVHDALCFALWHHQGSSSTIGQPIRKMLDLGPHDHMDKDEIAGAKRVQSALSKPASKRWVGLTDEQIEATFKRCGGRWNGDHWVIEDADLHPFVRTIEGADLNTLRAISDEYNAWIKHHAAGHSYDDFLAKREAKLREKNA